MFMKVFTPKSQPNPPKILPQPSKHPPKSIQNTTKIRAKHTQASSLKAPTQIPPKHPPEHPRTPQNTQIQPEPPECPKMLQFYYTFHRNGLSQPLSPKPLSLKPLSLKPNTST